MRIVSILLVVVGVLIVVAGWRNKQAEFLKAVT